MRVGRPDDVDVALALEHRGDALAHDRMIVDDEDADHFWIAGLSGRLRVGRQGHRHGDRRAAAGRAPDRRRGRRRGARDLRCPTGRTRGARAPRRRNPAPASATVRRSRPRTMSSRSDASRAPACLRTLVSASLAIRNSSDSTSAGSGPTSAISDADAHAGVGRELARQRAERFGERPVLERRRAQAGDRSPRLVEALTRHVERPPQRRRRAGRRGSRCDSAGFDVQRDGRESLRERVVDVAGDARALVGPRVLDRLLAQARPLDRHADLIRDRRQQIQLLPRQPPPAAHREVHHAERPIAGVQRHARMAAQAAASTRPARDCTAGASRLHSTTSMLRAVSWPLRNSSRHQHDRPVIRTGSCRYGGRLCTAAL